MNKKLLNLIIGVLFWLIGIIILISNPSSTFELAVLNVLGISLSILGFLLIMLALIKC